MCSRRVIQTIRKNKNCVPLPSIRIENGIRTRPHRGRPYFCGECLYQSNHEVHQSYSLMSQCQAKERIQSYCLESKKVVLFFLLVDELNLQYATPSDLLHVHSIREVIRSVRISTFVHIIKSFNQNRKWNKAANKNHSNKRITLEKHTPEEHFQCSDSNLLHGGADIWNSLQSCSLDDQFSLLE